MLGRWPGPISFFNHDSVARTYVYSSKGHETFAVHFEQLGKTNDLWGGKWGFLGWIRKWDKR